MQTNGFRCENGSHTPGKSFLWSLAMSYIHIPNPRPNKFLQSPSVILQCVRRHQPTPEELAASLERNRVRHGVSTAVDQWISAALNTSPPRATSGASSAQAMAVPTTSSDRCLIDQASIRGRPRLRLPVFLLMLSLVEIVNPAA